MVCLQVGFLPLIVIFKHNDSLIDTVLLAVASRVVASGEALIRLMAFIVTSVLWSFSGQVVVILCKSVDP